MSPESLFEGKFSVASMIYAFGYLLNELFTRGCQPFTETNRDTDDILLLLFLHLPSVRPFQWPCIPNEVFALIRGCTEFRLEKRWSLNRVQEEIRKLKSLDPCMQEAVTFPQININQEARSYLPERGIPRIVNAMMKNPNKYSNLLPSNWKLSPDVKVKELEVIASDSFSIDNGKAGETIIKERLTQEFVGNVLPDLEITQLPSVTCWTRSPVTTKGQDNFYLQERKYQCSAPLLERAKGFRFPKSNARASYAPLVHTKEALTVCLKLAKAVRSLHEKGWIHRDLRCANILITDSDLQIVFARISRMVPSKSLHCGEVFPDSIRWAAPEVLHAGVYSKMSDIFALVTTFYELFYVAQSVQERLNPDPLSLSPLANIKQEDVAQVVQEGILLPQPPGCPDELYNIICDGRHPDCHDRPNISQLTERLQKLCTETRPIAIVDPEDRRNGSPAKAHCSSRGPKFKVLREKIRTKFNKSMEQNDAQCHEFGYTNNERIQSLKDNTKVTAVSDSMVFATASFPCESRMPTHPLPPVPPDQNQSKGRQTESSPQNYPSTHETEHYKNDNQNDTYENESDGSLQNQPMSSDGNRSYENVKLITCPAGHRESRKVTGCGDVVSGCNQCMQLFSPAILRSREKTTDYNQPDQSAFSASNTNMASGSSDISSSRSQRTKLRDQTYENDEPHHENAFVGSADSNICSIYDEIDTSDEIYENDD